MRMIINITIGIFLISVGAAFTFTGLLAWEASATMVSPIGGKIFALAIMANGMIAFGAAIFGYMKAA